MQTSFMHKSFVLFLVSNPVFISYPKPIILRTYIPRNIEKIQRQASRFVTNSYSWSISVRNLSNSLGWKSRSYVKATMIYKITNNLVNIPCSQSLIPKDEPILPAKFLEK